ncbi:hypothetical protein [Mucilaginibacter ginsenosidivorax]|uniref:Uncharacterized protein n=1 Tax=Mucilaginibacter ginsenosidivorax TaxID=862126 RepID=A0A5B8W5K9_9SPHI|nr:hypothetical protein [Mucilaginibacter ginsenosidivorax]QEC79083.1 hypothetical protein FSB76_25175 [Mucilaginibacter ginsenosidivorax]
MESFELQVDQRTYKVIQSAIGKTTVFSVFSHSSFHTITKVGADCWEVVEHRFGNHQIPLQVIGKSIDDYFGL